MISESVVISSRRVASHHQIHLIDLDAFSRDDLAVSQSRDDLVVDFELDSDGVFGSLFNSK